MMKKWKWLFFSLLGVNIIVLLYFAINIFQPMKDSFMTNNFKEQEYVELSIHTNKEHLNKLVNHYIKKELGRKKLDYEIIFDEDVRLVGNIPVFDTEVGVNMSFTPKVQPNGDLLLKQKSISLGNVQLPVSFVLNLINEHYSIPRWVTIQPKEETIYVNLQQMRLKNGWKLKVKTFNLEKDQIIFKLFVPIK
jgi:uncharacterized protein YpmS